MISGFINVNKPKGVNSTPIVNRLKRLLKTPCGHLGTLDPMAEGVLPIAVGKASRVFDYVLEKKKVYIASFRFGVTSDTLDVTGELIPCGDIPKEEQIREVLPKLCGEIMQIPPIYSAKSVGGVRSYDLARRGIAVDLPARKVIVDSIDFLGGGDGEYRFEIKCGGGTYIRSIARDLGELLGTAAVMSALSRTASGKFTLETAVSADEIDSAEFALSHLLPPDFATDYPRYDADNSALFNGIRIPFEQSGYFHVYRDGAFVGIGEADGKTVKMKSYLV